MLTIQQIIMAAFAIYFALQGNAMLAKRIEKAELSDEERDRAKRWTARSQKRQTVGGIFYTLAAYLALYLATYLFQES